MVPVGGITHSNLAATNTKVEVTTVSGGAQVLAFNFTCFNPGAAVAYVQFFDLASANVTLGSTAPYFVIPLPANGGIDGADYVPKRFRTGVTYAVTATPSGSGAPASNCIVQFDYQ